MNSFLNYMIRYVLDNEEMHPIVLLGKSQEELGELAKDILKEHGYLRHKEYYPRMYDELADVFMVLFTAVALTDVGIKNDPLPGPTPEEIVTKFEEALKKKFQKYKELLESGDLRTRGH